MIDLKDTVILSRLDYDLLKDREQELRELRKFAKSLETNFVEEVSKKCSEHQEYLLRHFESAFMNPEKSNISGLEVHKRVERIYSLLQESTKQRGQ